MSIWTHHETVDVGGQTVTTQERTDGHYRAIFSGAKGAETTIEFSRVETDSRVAEFYREVGDRSVRTGEMELSHEVLRVFFERYED